jgi:hypothetical protein
MKQKALKNIPNPLKSKTLKFSYNSNNLQKIEETSIVASEEHYSLKVFLIRHAESNFNLAIRNLEKNKHNLDTETYLSHKEKIRFGKDFIDPDLTQTGISQCHLAGKSLHESSIDFKYVFVSPLKRTLMTCEKTLESLHSSGQINKKPEIIVHPLLFEKLEDSCDLIGDIKENIKLYPHYNWDLFKDVNHLPIYQLQHCDVKHPQYTHTDKDSYYNLALQNYHNCQNYDHHSLVLPAMTLLGREERFIESSKETFNRLQKLKKFMHENKFDGRILLVGHSVLFKHVTTEMVDEENLEPSQSEVLKNCEIAMVNFH